MAANDLHLAVDVASWWTTAVYEQAGAVHPVLFDGQVRLPSGVYADPGTLLTGVPAVAAGMTYPGYYRPDPLALLHAGAPAPAGPGQVEAVSALLAHVANTAAVQANASIQSLTIVTAHSWGFKARQRLLQAATTAGLPEPVLIDASHAAAAAAPAHGRFVLVGTADPALTILDTDGDHTKLATCRIHQPGSPTVDDALIRLAAPDAGLAADWRLTHEAQQARARLASSARAALILPEPLPPAVISRDTIATAAGPHLSELKSHVEQLLADADLDAADLGAVVLVGDDPLLETLSAHLAEAGLPPAVQVRDPHATARAALQIAQPLNGATGSTAATTRLPRTRLTLANLARLAVLATSSIAVLFQTIATTDYWTWGSSVHAIRVSVQNLGVAAALAALTAWAAATLVPTTWLMKSHAEDPATTGALLRRAYLGIAALSLVFAGLWGAGAVVGIGVNVLNDRYLYVTLGAAAPIAFSAVVIAIAAPRIPQPALTDWLRRASPPVLAITLSAAGVLLLEAGAALTFPVNHGDVDGPVRVIAAAMLGVGTALLATRQPWMRTITALTLGTGYVLVNSYRTDRYLVIAWIIAAAWWALTTATTTVKLTLPHDWRQRLRQLAPE
jgi:hypothetical protein